MNRAGAESGDSAYMNNQFPFNNWNKGDASLGSIALAQSLYGIKGALGGSRFLSNTCKFAQSGIASTTGLYISYPPASDLIVIAFNTANLKTADRARLFLLA
ncbi:hypothetical protein GCM10008018_43030 [Paenibacillus marchantiophytorum]|uniref:Beta-lactamase-related domain-containing protein n=1 Tax=Paenibacillus marchantiophytorum TaxID=1619310 RepID=A0ABQ1EYG5_9BACL|nr:hypothetical protein GCM10008018_43030 [Paenibacillus marchantiophytorum]